MLMHIMRRSHHDTHKLLTILITLIVLLIAVTPVAAESNPAKALCTGNEWTLTSQTGSRCR